MAKMIKTIIRLLCYRISKEEILNFTKVHFIIGLIGTWVVGMGRYWDDDGASLVQHLGLGSVIYIFLLAAFIWLIILPFSLSSWKYFTVLTFVALTSFPAILYAIPVERFYTLAQANKINVWFLGIVALWRLCLLFYFLKKFTGLSIGNIFTVTLMPICVIISALTALNLHRVVFNIMGGMRNPTAHDSSYFILMILTTISAILVLPLVIAYGIGIYNVRKEIKN
jgi:hypothetical protein